MKVIKEHIALFRSQVMDRLIEFMNQHGCEITTFEMNDSPIVKWGTLDKIQMSTSVGGISISFDYSDEYGNDTAYAEDLSLEELVAIVGWLEENAEAIDAASNDKANALLSYMYEDIFDEEMCQTFKVTNEVRFNGKRITLVTDYGVFGEHYALLNENDQDMWDEMKPGDRLNIAYQITDDYWKEKRKNCQ